MTANLLVVNGIADDFWEQAMGVISLSKTATRTYRLPGWSGWNQCSMSGGTAPGLGTSLGALASGTGRHGDYSYRCVQRDPEAVMAEVTATAFCPHCRTL
jgi:hypothetical protein